jgi:hypothetical protein
MMTKIDHDDLAAFTQQAEAKCCAPHPGKRLSRSQADVLVRLATYLIDR